MDTIRRTSAGIFIPQSLLKTVGDDFLVEVSGDVLIVEPRERRAARDKLKKIVQQLRRANRDLRGPTEALVRSEVDKVRLKRAHHS